MTEENVREEAGTSHDPQAEIARLNEKVARLEKELQERDRTEQQETQEEVSQSGQRDPKRDAGHPEGVAGDGGETDRDAELANLAKKDEKGKEKWVEKLTKLEQQCDYLMGSAQAGVTEKALLTDSLFSTAVSPFTEHIMSRQLPNKFKMPEIPVYTGLGDPIEHLASFRAHVALHATPDEVACRAFPLTLAGGAREWFRTLPPCSIANFESLARKFASQFMAGIVRKKPAQQLMTIKQGPQESLRSYLFRFNQERLAAESQNEQFIHCAIYQGIRKDGALMADLARRPAERLQDLYDRAEEFVNQEETLRAFRETEEAAKSGSRDRGRSKQETVPVRKEFTQRKPVKRVENYSWTPVNAPAREILMEIRKDPNYKDPSPIKGRPHPRNRHKYCHYHDSFGHWTNTCVALKEMIEKYIADGKLTRFLEKREDVTARFPSSRPAGGQGSGGRDAHSARPPYRYERRPARQPDRDFQPERARQRERSRSCNRHEGPGDFPEIQTIAGGFGGGGETYSARKSYAREMREVSIYSVARPLKAAKREKLTIAFSDKDYEGVYLPHSDALVVTMVIANHRIHRVLVDNGSSADILYKSAFDLMKISRDKVSTFRFPLVGFAGEQVMPLGSIELQVTVGSSPTQKTIPVKFLIVDQPSAYNAIFGRTAQAELKAVTSIPHLCMKFPTDDGVGVVRGEQKVARKCYNISLGNPSRDARPSVGASPSRDARPDPGAGSSSK
ncbi:uncharacterized protein LOC133861818 [Alnus glutinosa]|uniref:uncharacterized protein LOC133861818 n=1 Tax=Alnus glutinosa TaxID=3517 RepID=UPI002D7908AE|nr:uncharacterized protein LOC133861818 [Alnus glutinosa]